MAWQPDATQAKIHLGEDVELYPHAHELRRSGRVIRLERLPMDLLLLLVEKRDHLVTRDQIAERIWGKDVFLDTDNSINGAIRKIRQVLKDDPEHPRFIQTVTGKGYRFIAPLVEPAPATPASESSAVSARETPETAIEQAGPVVSRSWLFASSLILILLAASGAWLQWPRTPVGPQPADGRWMLAVLPFENLTGDPAQEYFSDGLTEEMISRLGNVNPQRLGVIARTSVMRYKDTREPLARIARELGVHYVLEGSVRRDGGKVRIAAQLVQASDQSHLWTRQYDRELSSLFALQGEIARAVVEQIQLTLVERKPSSAAPSTLSRNAYEAYDLYLRGRYFWNKRTPEGFQQAVEYFERAVAQDPGYARAYAGLADSYALMSNYSLAPAQELVPKARAAALKALELDEGLAEAHTSLALISLHYDWDWKTAEEEFRRALQLDPNYATAHHWYAELLGFHGRFDEAFVESERARQLDPLSLIIATDHGALLYFSRQYDSAIEQFQRVLEMEPGFPRAHLFIHAYAQKGMYSDALAGIEKWRHGDDSPWPWALQAYVYGRLGKRAEALQALQQLEHVNREKRLELAPLLALAYAGMNERDTTIAWLEEGYRRRSSQLMSLKVEPVFDTVRDDPRFHDLMRRVGLAP